MTNVACRQCGSINLLAAESCRQCGAELRFISTQSTWTPSGRTEEAQGGESPGEQTFSFTPEIGPFTGIGSVLSPTISIFTKNFWLIFKLTFLIFAPFEVFKAISLRNEPTYQLAVGSFFLWVFCQAIVTPSLAYSLVQVMRTGTAPTLNDAYRFGLSKIGKLVLTASMAWILEALGFICLIVPGIILGLAFEVIYPLVALEDLSPVETLKRSYRLTNGYKGSIFLVGLVFGLLIGAVNIPVSIATSISTLFGVFSWVPYAAGSLVSDVLSEATLVLSLVIYLSLLRTKENTHNFGAASDDLPPPPPDFR